MLILWKCRDLKLETETSIINSWLVNLNALVALKYKYNILNELWELVNSLKSLSILQGLPAPSINPQLTGKVGKMHLFVFKVIHSGNLVKT